jgi:AraC family transcriptional activator of pobA
VKYLTKGAYFYYKITNFIIIFVHNDSKNVVLINMRTTLPYIQFSILPSSKDMAAFEDKLRLYGNANESAQNRSYELLHTLQATFPNRVVFTIVIICQEGEIKTRCNLKDYTIRKDQLLIVVPNTIVESLELLPGSKVLCMAVSDDSYSPTLTQFHSAYERSRFVSPIFANIGEELMAEAIASYSHLWHMLRRFPDRMTDDLVRAYIQVMSGVVAISMAKELERVVSVPLSAADKTLKSFLSNLAEGYTEHRDVAYYAGLACLSPKYFAKSVLKASGRSPLDWIQEYVILEAKTMLRSGAYSVQQVSDALNFPSISHFARYFKNAAGISPKKYQSQG